MNPMKKIVKAIVSVFRAMRDMVSNIRKQTKMWNEWERFCNEKLSKQDDLDELLDTHLKAIAELLGFDPKPLKEGIGYIRIRLKIKLKILDLYSKMMAIKEPK